MLRFYRSTIGKKILMAVSGIVGVAFLILHMLGNLQIFQGPAKINGYAAILHGPLAEVVLAQRVVLLVAVTVHVVMAWQLTMRARAARPTSYARCLADHASGRHSSPGVHPDSHPALHHR